MGSLNVKQTHNVTVCTMGLIKKEGEKCRKLEHFKLAFLQFDSTWTAELNQCKLNKGMFNKSFLAECTAILKT